MLGFCELEWRPLNETIKNAPLGKYKNLKGLLIALALVIWR